MEPLVDIVIEDDRWDDLGLDSLAQGAVAASLAYLGLSGVTCCVMACDDGRIAELNLQFRSKAVPTNVLSWPSQERAADMDGDAPDLPLGDDDDPEELGDIAIAFDTCAREADAAGKAMTDHVTHLLVHGLLHLLGYDHIRDADATLMEQTEVAILAQMGLSDPYSN